MKIVYFLLLFLLPLYLLSGNLPVKYKNVKVVDTDTLEPLAGVSIILSDTIIYTDLYGIFKLDNNSQEIIEINFISYESCDYDTTMKDNSIIFLKSL